MRRTLADWDQILPEKQYSFEEPDDFVADFAKSTLKENRTEALDLACGAGRHVIYMAEHGFKVTGADVSGAGLQMTKERLRKRGLRAILVKSSMNHLPYVDSCFDAVVCTRAIYHQKVTGIKETITEIRRVLREGGAILVDFLSERTYSYGKGIKTEEGTFVETDGVERGVTHHFAGKEEIERLFHSFEILSIILHEADVDGELRSRWVIKAIK